MWIAIFIFTLILGLLFWKVSNLKEGFAGALTQLYAKGPQDRHLIGNAEKYYLWYPYYESVWNNPTRLTGYYGHYGYYYNPYHRRFPFRYGHIYPSYYPYY